jgi:D-tyrosyl-tRNA(Tyr) deacylase
MRAVVQRVHHAKVLVAGEVVGAIDRGLCVFVGAARGDTEGDITAMAEKITGLRIFPDSAGKMGLAVADVAGAVLIVSQFTVCGDARRGRRPSFDGAMAPGDALIAYQHLVREVEQRGVAVATGRFAADMRVVVDNDGPVTILIDSRKVF